MNHRSARIAFLVKSFPKLSETFILGEVLGLEARGLSLTIFTLVANAESIKHEATEKVRAPIIRLRQRSQFVAALRWSEHWAIMRKHPARYLAAALSCIQRKEPGRWCDFSLACTLARQLLALGIKHVHAHFASQPAAVAEIASRLIGCTYSISAHAKDIYTSNPKVLAERMAKAQFTVTCTKHNVDFLREIARPGTNVHLMYHGIDHAQFENESRDATNAALILAVGRLKEKKGFLTLIDACALLRDRSMTFRCEIIGYGEEQGRLARRIAEHGLQAHVHLLGAMTHTEVVARYRAATLFAAPCMVANDGDRDGIPNVLLEAMAMALPVVTTPVSGIPEVITHLGTGLLVPPNRVEALADSIQNLLGDAELRRRLGQAARQVVVERFSHQKNLDTVQGLLLHAVCCPALPPVTTEHAHA